MTHAKQEIGVVVHFEAKPGKEAELLKLMTELLEPTRKEPGCLRYELNQEIENSAAFTFVEKFISRQDFETHVKQSYSARFGGLAEPLIQSKKVRLSHELLATDAAEEPTTAEAVIIVAHFTALPGKRQELLEFLQTLAEPTRQEPGCVRYELNQDLDDSSTFTFVETFADKGGFDAHCATPYVARLFELLPVLAGEQYIGVHKRIQA